MLGGINSKLWLAFIFCFISAIGAKAKTTDSTLNRNWPVFDLKMDDSTFIAYKMNTLDTLMVNNLNINGSEIKFKSIKFRGKSSRKFVRKSFNVKLNEKVTFNFGGENIETSQFCLISMNMDRYYVHSKLAWDIYELLTGFSLYNQYVECRINGISQGIYLLTQSPTEYVLCENSGLMVFRRKAPGKFELEKACKNYKKSVPFYSHQLDKLYSGLSKKGKELEAHIREYINLDQYMTWLAFNYIIGNGDYTDEVYFYCNNAEKPVFNIIPWDLDDAFTFLRHETILNGIQPDPKMKVYSLEDPLDKAIANDSYLYSLYLAKYHEAVAKISETDLDKLIDSVYLQVLPFYQALNIAELSSTDYYGPYKAESLKEKLKSIVINIRKQINN